MNKKMVLLISAGILMAGFIFKYIEKNGKKQVVFAVYNVPEFERNELENCVKDFMSENPEINVKLKEYKRSYSDLKAGIDDPKEPIDILILSYPLLSGFAENDLIQPMTKYHGIEKTKDGLSWEAFGYLRNTPPHALIFNEEFLKNTKMKLPKSENEFEAILQEFKKSGVQYPFLVDTEMTEYLSDPAWNENLKAMKGVDLIHLDYLLQKKLMGLTSETGEENRYEAFLKKKTAAIVSTVPGINYIENSDQSLKFRIISFFHEEDSKVNVLFYNRYAIGKNSKNPDLAFKFIEFLNNCNY